MLCLLEILETLAFFKLVFYFAIQDCLIVLPAVVVRDIVMSRRLFSQTAAISAAARMHKRTASESV